MSELLTDKLDNSDAVEERMHQLEQRVRELEQAAAYDEAEIAVLLQRIEKAREILESLNEYGWFFRLKPALEALEGK